MSRNEIVRRSILKIILCFLALPVLISIFTSKASLQNTNAANAVRVSNANRLPGKTPPRRPSRRTANTSSVSANKFPDDVYLPEPTPTPPANSTVRGRAFYAETGRPVKRSLVILMKDDFSDGPSNGTSALTDGNGVFQVKNVRAGTYYAVVNAPGVVSPLAYADFSKGGDREALKDSFEGFDPIVVDGLNDTDVQVPARRGGAIGGRVMYDDGDAAIGVRVDILRKVGDKYLGVIPNFSAILSMMSGSGTFQTDDRGVYRFAGLPPGDYVVKVTESATHSESIAKSYYNPIESMLTGDSFLTVFYPDAFDAKSAQLINIQFGQELSEINLTIPSRNLYNLQGKLVNLKDKSPVKARINLKKENADDTFTLFTGMGRRQKLAALTDENGNWNFKELPKGKYKLIIEPVENETTYQTYAGNYGNSNSPAVVNAPAKPRLAKKTQEITIEDKDLTEMVIEVGYGATVSGTASVENSQEMPERISITAYSDAGEDAVSTSIFNSRDPEARTSSKVNYEFRLENVPEGENYFLVQTEDKDYYVKSATADGVDLLSKPFAFKEGEVLRNVRIVLAKDVGTLKGVVLSDAKEPLKGLNILIVPTDAAKRKMIGYLREATTNEKGEFETKAAPGEYAVVFFDQSALAKSREELQKWIDEAVKDAPLVKIETGKTETVTIKRKN